MKTLNALIYLLATGFGSGYLPVAPGTWGSIVGVILTALLLPLGIPILWVVFLLVLLMGWMCSHIIVSQHGVDPDPGFIVIDEIGGIMLTILLFACGNHLYSGDYGWIVPETLGDLWGIPLISLLFIFLSFRVFDIYKPFPIYLIDEKLAKVRSLKGLGVMVDDLVAAIPAAILAFGVTWAVLTSLYLN